MIQEFEYLIYPTDLVILCILHNMDPVDPLTDADFTNPNHNPEAVKAVLKSRTWAIKQMDMTPGGYTLFERVITK